MKIEKAVEIRDAKIQFVSLVDKAANKRQFLITKEEDNQAQFTSLGKILKVDESTHYITGIVYEPLVEDSHGNFMTEEEIQKAAYWFAKNGDKVDLQHSFEQADGITVVETYVTPCDMEISEQKVLKGTWIMTTEVDNQEVWDKVQKGEVTGFSMGGVGKYSKKDVELATIEKKSIFKKMAEAFGFDVVEKGEVRDKYSEKVKIDSFWNAFYSLEKTLYEYNWESDEANFETDETKIREALSEFSEIVIELLTEKEIMKSLAKLKSGNKVIDKNYTDKKEEEEMTKQEIQELINESIKKSMESTNNQQQTDVTETLTTKSIQDMIDNAVQKALNPVDEPLSKESVEAMVSKAIEPILKARGIPNNLNTEQSIEKSEQHYLSGIL